MNRWREYLSPIIYFSQNWISLTGVVLVTTAAVLWLFLLPSSFTLEGRNPYIGILSWLMLPGVFIFGLLLIPLGMYFQRRKEKGGIGIPEHLPAIDLQSPKVRRIALFVIVTTFVNLVIAGHGTYTAVEYMDGVTFCGLTCHTVMRPEYTAYQNSPHSRVECVKCHIGPGASWFVKSKISGARQVLAVAMGTYERPIATPVQNLRPARDTCESCHWPDKYGGERLRFLEKYTEDETNSKTTTVLMMHIGGNRNGHRGIHGAHVGQGVTIRYRPEDMKRSKIPWVSREMGGKTVEYIAEGAKDWQKIPERVMDCVDCHNRPTHIFEMPDRGMDRVMGEKPELVSIPFLKKKGMELLKADYPSQEQAEKEITSKLAAYYRQSYPAVKPEAVDAAAKAIFSVYARNVFPEMKLTWGSYSNNIGHMNFPGCFRCHDDAHGKPDASGAKLSQDCSMCHEVLSMEEKEPKILESLGLQKPSAAPAPSGH